jgi:hypothetical protein
MKSRLQHSKSIIFFLATGPKFLIASAAPVLVGSCLGYATAGFAQTRLSSRRPGSAKGFAGGERPEPQPDRRAWFGNLSIIG